MHDKLRVVRALLAKTVANGCTPAEAASARVKAEEVAARHGIDLARPGARPSRPAGPRSAGPDRHRSVHPNFDIHKDDMGDLLRDIEERVRAHFRQTESEEEARRRAPDDWGVKAYRNVGEMAREQLLRRFVIRERGEVVARGAGLPLSEVLRRICERFPDCHTTTNTLRWHESRLRREGRDVPKRWGPAKRGAAPDRGNPR